jgi:hypothetical protein
MILPVRVPPEEIFSERFAQRVDHPNKCRYVATETGFRRAKPSVHHPHLWCREWCTSGHWSSHHGMSAT